MIKAIFFDIDGTLIPFETHVVSENTKNALKQLRENGIRIFLATGREKAGIEVLNDIPFDGYITLNGQMCFTKDEIVYENPIPKEDLHKIVDYINAHPCPAAFVKRDFKVYNYRDERADAIDAITHNDHQPAGDISDIFDVPVYQVMTYVNEEEEKQLVQELPNCTFNRWHPTFTDISPKGGTKVKGIDRFLEYYNIDLSETMAFGDGGNDKPMLEHVAVSVAMGNAKEEVKQIASYITEEAKDDGIVTALKHYNLIR